MGTTVLVLDEAHDLTSVIGVPQLWHCAG